ncbi:MAG: D-ribose pyranase [Anaerolineaceae bacterium]
MKKTTLLNASLSETIASMGHTDMLVISDAGLPVPAGPRRIDLALTRGVPGFLQTLEVILSELNVERIIIARETAQVSPQIFEAVKRLLPNIPVEQISHEEFKRTTASARAVVRTGEFTSYANVILVSGVDFSK